MPPARRPNSRCASSHDAPRESSTLPRPPPPPPPLEDGKPVVVAVRLLSLQQLLLLLSRNVEKDKASTQSLSYTLCPQLTLEYRERSVTEKNPLSNARTLPHPPTRRNCSSGADLPTPPSQENTLLETHEATDARHDHQGNRSIFRHIKV